MSVIFFRKASLSCVSYAYAWEFINILVFGKIMWKLQKKVKEREASLLSNPF